MDAAPHGHATTFVGALTTRGFIAPSVADGAVGGELSLGYVEPVRVPERRGDVVVLDDLGSHERAGVRAAIEGAGCRVLYLPPYSADRSPIENASPKLEAVLRAAAERAVDRLWATIGRRLDRFTRRECRNYFRHCGYRRHASRS